MSQSAFGSLLLINYLAECYCSQISFCYSLTPLTSFCYTLSALSSVCSYVL